FFITKKDSSLYLINNAQRVNKVTLRNANPPLNYEEFNKVFKGYEIISLLDLFLGYN
ncbi:hypothetical protein B0T13DRAFT_397373, partial [Neurospora crassa]